MGFNNKHKIFYDSEFTGLHKDTTLISIGMVSESGNYFYAEFTDYDKNQVTPWIQEHVIDNLMLTDHRNQDIFDLLKMENGFSVEVSGDTKTVKMYLEYWLRSECHESDGNPDLYKQIQFYSDCYTYDWMLLNDLICKEGDALNIPKYIDYIPIDLSTALMVNGIDPDITREEYVGESLNDLNRINPFSEWIRESDNIKHNSLWDAYVCELCFKKIGIKDNNTDNLEDIMDLEVDD